MSRYLIINADGFGFTRGINRAVFEVAAAGAISSISVNTNFPAIDELPKFCKLFPGISVGVHLNPSVGPSVLQPSSIPSLLGQDGYFHGKYLRRRLLLKKIRMNELFDELCAQVNLVRNMGVVITHLDSHKNEHLLPGYFEVFLRVAKKFKIYRMRTHRHAIALESSNPRMTAARYYGQNPRTALMHLYTRLRMRQAQRRGMHMPDRLVQLGYGTGLTKGDLKSWLMILRNLPEGVNELYCHPGYVDDTLRTFSWITTEREDTTKALLSNEFRIELEQSGVRLVPFSVV